MEHLWNLGGPLVVALIVALAGAYVRSERTGRERDRKLDAIIAVFEGQSADPITGRHSTVGLVDQVTEIQEQLRRNGGTTLRDSVSRIEVGLADVRDTQLSTMQQAAADRRRQAMIEELLRKHMRDGKTLLEVGQHNDDLLWSALRAAGISIADPVPLPDATLVLPEDEQ
jgi:hypothetical protein